MSPARVPVRVPFLCGHDSLETDLTDEIFEQRCGEILDRAVAPIMRAMDKANLRKEDIDFVLLAGGSSHLPGISRRAQTILGIEPKRVPRDPMYAVAYGAALYHRRILSLPTTDREARILGYDLGLLVREGMTLTVKLLVDKNERLPYSYNHDHPLNERQSEVTIELRTGDVSRPELTHPLRSRILQLGLGGSTGQSVRVLVQVDENRIVHLEALDTSNPTKRIAFNINSPIIPHDDLKARRTLLGIQSASEENNRTYNAAKHPCVGIDLGTTTSELAHVSRTGTPEPACLENPLAPSYYDKRSYPSVIFFPQSGSGPEVANVVALDALQDEKLRDRAFDGFKIHMGSDREERRLAEGVSVTPMALSAYLLDRMWRDANASSVGAASLLKSAVVTVPASFGPDQCADTMNAARLAGIEEVRLIDEPTAAFLYYHHLYPDVANSGQGRVLVLDFGGGTADVTILRTKEGAGAEFGYKDMLYECLAYDGDTNCGGRLVDEGIAGYLQEEFERTHNYSLKEYPASLYRLRQQAELIKRALSETMAGGA